MISIAFIPVTWAVRIVTNSTYDAHSEYLMALHNEAPDYIKGLFHRLSDRSDTQSRVLRNFNTDLFLCSKRPRTEKIRS